MVYDGLQIGPLESGADAGSGQQWFRFTTDGPGTSSSSVTLQVSDPSAGTLTFSLYTDPTQAASEQAVSTSGTVALSLNNLPAGQYFVSVAPDSLTQITGYQLRFDSPSPASGAVVGSTAHPNDRSIKSSDLGLIDTTTEFAGNVIQATAPAWFEFETPRESTVKRKVVIQSPFAGTITASLYNSFPSSDVSPVSTLTLTGTLTIPYDEITAGSTTSSTTYWLELTANGASAQLWPHCACSRPHPRRSRPANRWSRAKTTRRPSPSRPPIPPAIR